MASSNARADAATPPTAAYVHIPFCLSKCPYCDFDSFADRENLFDPYVDAVCKEIARQTQFAYNQCSPLSNHPPLSSVFFGGGTPTLLGSHRLGQILDTIKANCAFADVCEVTVEANPGTVNAGMLEDMLKSGFNRISFGVQSLDPSALTTLGRRHSVEDALQAVAKARSAGFANISFDLMFAVPGQSRESWEETLSTAILLSPQHISAYELTIEECTPFHRMREDQTLVETPEDTRLAMFEHTVKALTKAGYKHYEVSNYAKPGSECAHNIIYWHNQPYYGFGAGAASYLGGVRAKRAARPEDYIACINGGRDPIESSEHLNGAARDAETMMLGLRLLDGMPESVVDAMDCRLQERVNSLITQGLLERSIGTLKTTRQGLLILNDVVVELMRVV